MHLLILLQEEEHYWTEGWIEYSLYGIVVIGIVWFLISRLRKGGKKNREKNRE